MVEFNEFEQSLKSVFNLAPLNLSRGIQYTTKLLYFEIRLIPF